MRKTKARKTRKLPPRENFHIYSILKSRAELKVVEMIHVLIISQV